MSQREISNKASNVASRSELGRLPLIINIYKKIPYYILYLLRKNEDIQSTPALRTPRYYGHPAITDSSKIPGESYRRLTEINSRYYGLSLLRTYGHFIRSQRHNFIVFSLVIADTEQHLGIFAHISSVFFLLFETVFVFLGRFPLLLSISLFSSLQSRCHE